MANSVSVIGSLAERETNLIETLEAGIARGVGSSISIGGSFGGGVTLTGGGLFVNESGSELLRGFVNGMSVGELVIPDITQPARIDTVLEVAGPSFSADGLYSIIERDGNSVSARLNLDHLLSQWAGLEFAFSGSEQDDRFEEGRLFTLVGSDSFNGFAGDDFIFAGAGDDVIRGGAGNDTLDGAAGDDTASGLGALGSYVLTFDGTSGAVTLEDKRGGGTGLDSLTSVELLQFADGFSLNNNGVFDLREISGAVGLSQEMLTTFVEMYVAYFDRAPDALGLLYWGTRLADGMQLGQIAQSFFFQEETFALYPELEGLDGVSDPSVLPTEFYDKLVVDTYSKLLERAPDEAGRIFWVGELENGNVRLGEFVLAIINGAKDFNPDGATPEQIAQAALDTQTVEDKGLLGYAFAVDGGMNNVDNASDVMALYDVADRAGTISQAEALIAQYRIEAESAGSTEFIVEVAAVGDDPFAVA